MVPTCTGKVDGGGSTKRDERIDSRRGRVERRGRGIWGERGEMGRDGEKGEDGERVGEMGREWERWGERGRWGEQSSQSEGTGSGRAEAALSQLKRSKHQKGRFEGTSS